MLRTGVFIKRVAYKEHTYARLFPAHVAPAVCFLFALHVYLIPSHAVSHFRLLFITYPAHARQISEIPKRLIMLVPGPPELGRAAPGVLPTVNVAVA